MFNTALRSDHPVHSRHHGIAPGLTTQLLLTAILCFVSSAYQLDAQERDGFQPLNQHMMPGQAAGWLNSIRGYDPTWMQPVRVELPTGGNVSIYSGSSASQGVLPSPAQFGVNAGHIYRLKLSEIPELPGEELYPSIEILDRLHPPFGRENDFPIPIVFTLADMKLALAGKLVTRVVYLEQPQLASPEDPLRREIPISVAPNENALHEADRLGRPMIIVRIGGRVPSEYDESVTFYGSGGAVDLRPVEANRPGVARLSKPGRSGAVVAR